MRHLAEPNLPPPLLSAAHHLALHCFADLRTSRDEMRDHWFSPYFMTAALRISSCSTRVLALVSVTGLQQRDGKLQAVQQQ